MVHKHHVCEQYLPSTKNQAKISIPVHSVPSGRSDLLTYFGQLLITDIYDQIVSDLCQLFTNSQNYHSKSLNIV